MLIPDSLNNFIKHTVALAVFKKKITHFLQKKASYHITKNDYPLERLLEKKLNFPNRMQ